MAWYEAQALHWCHHCRATLYADTLPELIAKTIDAGWAYQQRWVNGHVVWVRVCAKHRR